LAMIISSFSRDKKISSDVIRLIFSEAGPNRVMFIPLSFSVPLPVA